VSSQIKRQRTTFLDLLDRDWNEVHSHDPRERCSELSRYSMADDIECERGTDPDFLTITIALRLSCDALKPLR
jgi:hypothetical protein